MNNNNNTIVCLEGNIGAGKSTLIEILISIETTKKIFIIPEPIRTWENYKDENGKSIFELYYNDKKKFSYIFQNLVLNSFADNIIKYNNSNNDSILIFERSLLSTKEIFTKLLYDDKYITKLEYDIFCSSYNTIINLLQSYRMDLLPIIYIKTESKICLDRIKKEID